METELFSDWTFDKVEEFEKDSNGLILFNSTGENALSVQNHEGKLTIYPDRISSDEITDYPSVFILHESDVVRLYKYMTEILKSNPDKYQYSQP